jgi:hypothetical protein
VRIILQLVIVLSGLLLAREFMTHSNEHLRLVLRWASIATENIATVHEAPTSVAPAAVGPIAEVSAPSIVIVHEAPAVLAPITEVWVQSATVHDEPPALLAPTPVAQIARVSAQSIAILRKSPALVARTDVARIAEISPKSVATRSAPLATMEAPITAVSLRSIGTVQERSAPAETIATVRDEPPPQLAPMGVAPIIDVPMQSIAVVDDVPAPVAPATACEQIWDQMTHMSRDEWAEACRRVDELRLVVRN